TRRCQAQAWQTGHHESQTGSVALRSWGSSDQMCGRFGLLAFPECSLQQVWTMLERTKPPFRADQVGSLIRPPSLVAARQAAERGEITAAELRRIQEEAIRGIVQMQEDVGLMPITDGEYNRQAWHRDFLLRFDNV